MTIPAENNRRPSAIDSSVLSSYREQSSNFFAGDYVHNSHIMEHLEVDSVRDDLDDERLIWAATKKFAIANRENPVRAVVSSAEMRDSDELRPSQVSAASMRRNFFRIFKRDDSFLEVSRLEIQRVRAMHNRFQEGSEFSFNYNTLLVIASVIAALGLGSNSTATIIASMLVSPLMGPVMGMAYAATISDLRMFRIAFVTEVLSLLTCIVVGAAVAACMIPLPFYELSENWPAPEMVSRGKMENFYIGIPVAFASGLGVAVSVLDDQTSSLVGVAISASLLPPAINAGMLWTTYFFDDEETNAEHDLFNEGMVSLGLTVINILMIILASMLMFRVKEVMPIKKKKIFWTDLGLARKIYRNKALYDNDTQVSNGIRRLGRRVSLAVQTFPFSRTRSSQSHTNGASSPTSPNDVPRGSDDDSTLIQARRGDGFLSTVEERISMETRSSSLNASSNV